MHQKTLRTEWHLLLEIFLRITDKLGSPEIDLFAPRRNNQLPTYVLWKPDPGVSYVDAFPFPGALRTATYKRYINSIIVIIIIICLLVSFRGRFGAYSMSCKSHKSCPCFRGETMWVPSPLRPFINDTRYVVAYYPFYRRGFHEGTTAFTLCRWAFVVLWIIYFLL